MTKQADKNFVKNSPKGFTLIEILIVFTIIAILALAFLFAISIQRKKAEDAAIKADLDRLKVAFEDYYNDYHCYPPSTWFDGAEDCGSTNLQPYLPAIKCDKHTGLPYVLETDLTGCKWFKLYGELALPRTDTQALSLCSSSGSSLGNYGVSSTDVSVSVSCPGVPSGSSAASAIPSPTSSVLPVPSPSPFPSGFVPPPVDPNYTYYCSGVRNCTSYDPYKFYCTSTFTDSNCGGDCESPSACILR